MMMPDLSGYMNAKYGSLAEVEVSKDEMIQLLRDAGKDDPEFYVRICEMMGSSILIGNKMVRLKTEQDDGTVSQE